MLRFIAKCIFRSAAFIMALWLVVAGLAYVSNVLRSHGQKESTSHREDVAPPSEYEIAIEDEYRNANEAVERDPKSSTGLADRGRANMRKRRWPEALADLNKAVELDPKSAVAHARRSECLLATTNQEQARLDCEEAIRLDPKCAEAYIARAMGMLATSDTLRALQDCNQAVLLNPLMARAYLVRGIVRRNTNRDLAKQDYDDAIRLDRLLVPAYFERGLLYARQGEIEIAIGDLQKATSLDPSRGGAHIYLGIASWQVGQTETAIKEIATGLSLRDTGDDLTNKGLVYLSCAYTDRGCSHAKSGDYARAESDFLECVRINPESDRGHANLAQLYCDMGRSTEAMKSLESAERFRNDLDQEQLRELRDRIEGRFRLAGASQPSPPARAVNGRTGSSEEFLDPRLPQPSQNGNNGSRAKKVLESLADKVLTKENGLLALEVALAWAKHRHSEPKVSVDGYRRQDGTYVKPYDRAFPKR